MDVNYKSFVGLVARTNIRVSQPPPIPTVIFKKNVSTSDHLTVDF